MLLYSLRRILHTIPVFFGATILLFIAMYILPGDPVQLQAGSRAMSPTLHATITKDLHLDESLPQQYLYYIGGIAQGDLGTSYQKDRPVADILLEKFPNSIRLALAAIFVEVLLGLVAGILSAIKRYSFLDALVTVSTTVLVAVPVFWLGLLLQIIFGVNLKILPISGMGEGEWTNYVLPAVTLASASMAYVARLARSQLSEVMDQDYIRAAYARGLNRIIVIGKHALRNALIPVVTFIGIDLGALMGGAVLTEAIFNWPGVGFTLFQAILQRDQPIVLGAAIFLVGIFILINLIVDLIYGYLDPRIRLGKNEAA